MSVDLALRALAVARTFPFLRSADDYALRVIAGLMEPVSLRAGQTLLRQGDRGDSMFLVESGELRALVRRPDGLQTEVSRLGPGEPIGEMQLVGSGLRSATVEAVTDVTLFRLPQTSFDSLAATAPGVFREAVLITQKRLHAAQLALALPGVFGPLSPALVDQISAEVEWIALAQGEALFHQGDECDGWYLVLSGRLRAVAVDEATGEERALSEIAAGGSLGELALLSGERRSATPYAVRDTLVVRFPVEAFKQVAAAHPDVLLSISRTLISRLQNVSRPPPPPASLVIAVVPASGRQGVSPFARALTAGLAKIGRAVHVDAEHLAAAAVLDGVRGLAADHPGWLRFSRWLEDQQAAGGFIVLEADTAALGWATRAIGHADHVVVVADASGDRTPGEIEAKLLGPGASARRARRTLVLVHPPGTRVPSGTAAWLEPRHVDSHFHALDGRQEDVNRLARSLTGRAVGLALGGGGARGYAHLGVYRALRELGIPVDVIGGTSAGSIMAAQLALGLSHEEILELNRRVIALKPFHEYTIPMVAMLKTKAIEESARLSFGETCIEDLWLPYFAISSDLTAAEMVIHEKGPVWFATRASGSIPGVAVPVVEGTHLLVDGGVMNNLPGDVMRSRCGGGPVIAVNVSPEEDLRIGPEGFPSQWQIFWNRILPGVDRVEVPRIFDILMRTTMLASAGRTAQVRRSVDLYLAPPVDRFTTLEIERIDEIIEVGYRYALEAAAHFRLAAVKETVMAAGAGRAA